jgi:hypothetical protein
MPWLSGTATPPAAGFCVVFPQVPNTTVHFDANSSDIAKAIAAPHVGTSFNHDGAAYKGLIRPRPSESSDDSATDYSEYQKNVKSGKWRELVNGE